MRLYESWLAVEMNYLSDYETLFSLASLTRNPPITPEDWDAVSDAASAALRRAQAHVRASVCKGEEEHLQPYVHGDVRLNNIMVKREDDGCWSVKFIDFDCVPLHLMLAKHDNKLLAKQCSDARRKLTTRTVLQSLQSLSVGR